MRLIERVIFHHSASSQSTSLRQVEMWHEKRWGRGIEYHYIINVISGIARLHICQPLGMRVWHAGREGNGNSAGVLITGWNGDSALRANMGWYPGQIRLGQELLSALRLTHNIKWWGGHRDVKATICPGLKVRDIFT